MPSSPTVGIPTADLVEAAGLDRFGLEEIEWLIAAGEPLTADERGCEPSVPHAPLAEPVLHPC